MYLTIKSNRITSISNLIVSLSAIFFSVSYFSAYALFISISVIFMVNVTLLYSKGFLGLNKKILAFIIASNFFVFYFSIFHDFYFNFYIKVCLINLYILGLGVLVSSQALNRFDVLIIIKYFIIIHSALFLIQFVMFQTTDYLIDFDSMIRTSPSEMLHLTKALDGSIVKLRATGLFSEPSFYSMTVVPFSALLLFIQKRVCYAVFVGFFTSFLSLSISSIGIIMLIVAFYLLMNRTSLKLKAFIVVITIVLYPFISDFYDSRINVGVDYDAVGSRTLILDEFLLRGYILNIFGAGFLWDETSSLGVTGLSGFHVRDSSFYAYLLFCSGLLGFTLFNISLYFLFRKRKELLILFLLVLLFKYHFVSGIFLLIFSTYLYFSNEYE